MKPVVFDLDDLCIEMDPWDQLHHMKDWFPGLKVTLFAIPGRCSPQLLDKYKALDWVELGVHGYHHSSMECAIWGYDEAEAKLAELAEWWPGPKVFKAPGWTKNEHVEKALFDGGWMVADHVLHAPFWWTYDIARYVYNATDEVIPVHGHTWDTCDNGPENWAEMFEDIPMDSEFQFVSEVARPLDDFDGVQDATSSWSHISNWGKAAAQRMHDFVNLTEVTGSVADFGGNDGFALLEATDKGLDTICVDNDTKRLLYAKFVYGLKTKKTDLTKLDMEDNSVDWGFSSHTLEHIQDIHAAVAEIKRVCKKGCYFVVPVESEDDFAGNPAHHHRFTHKGWAELLDCTTSAENPREFVGLWLK